MPQYAQDYKRGIALDSCRNLYELNILRLNEVNLINFAYAKILISSWLVLLCINWCKFITEFVSAPYYKNEWMELDKLCNKCRQIDVAKSAWILSILVNQVISGRLFSHTMAPGGGICVTLIQF